MMQAMNVCPSCSEKVVHELPAGSFLVCPFCATRLQVVYDTERRLERAGLGIEYVVQPPTAEERRDRTVRIAMRPEPGHPSESVWGVPFLAALLGARAACLPTDEHEPEDGSRLPKVPD